MNILHLADFPANEDYHARPDLSYTGFKVFKRSPLEYEHRFVKGFDPGPTPAMEFGSLIHAFALEPDTALTDYQVRVEMPLRSKAYKEMFVTHLHMIGAELGDRMDDELVAMSADELRDLEKTAPVRFVAEDDYERGLFCAKIARCHLPLYIGHKIEAAFYARIEGVDVQCKCDCIDETGQIYDIKTCADIHRFERGLAMGDMIYGDTWYRMVIEAATGFLPPPIRYVGIETKQPHDCIVRWHPEDLYPMVKEEILGDLRRFAECQQDRQWPGLEDKAEIKLASFVRNKFFDLPEDFFNINEPEGV